MMKTKRGSKQSVLDSPRDEEVKRIRDLEQENKYFQKEIEELRLKLGNASSNLSGSAEKLKDEYLQKLTLLEDQVADLKNKLEYKSQFSVQRPKGDEATKQSQYEIQSLKAQKVQLQCKMKVESLQFRLCKASLEKEVLQIKRDGRRNQYEMQKLSDANQILKLVLQRKSLEASIATKRLRDLLESRKALSQKRAGARNVSNPGIQILENELDLTTQLHALCSDYERQMDVMVEENAMLKEEVEVLKEEKSRYVIQAEDFGSIEKDLDIKELKEQVTNLSGMLRQLRVQKTELDGSNKSQGVLSDLSVSVATTSEQSVKKKNKKKEKKSLLGSERLETSDVTRNKSRSGVCCSCSKKSLCKTTKCQCRHMGGSCGDSCGCAAAKCSNREPSSVQSPQTQTTAEKKPLEPVKCALLDDSAEKNDLGLGKKPLSDIGNLRLRRKA